MDFESTGVKLIEKACFSTMHVYFRVNFNMMKDIGHLVSVTFFETLCSIYSDAVSLVLRLVLFYKHSFLAMLTNKTRKGLAWYVSLP